MKALLALAASLALAACGGKHPDKDTTAGHGSGADPTAGSGAGSGSTTTVATDPAKPLSEDECRQMFGHIIDLGLVERHKQKPDEPAFKPEVIQELKDKSAKDGMGQCLPAPREQFDCIMAAKDAESLRACGA
jgi:hypothetical protein